MPYSSTSELPVRVRDSIPSAEGKELFMEVVNSSLYDGKSESVSFASAWAALQNAGYGQDDDGLWINKADPDASDVHVPALMGNSKGGKKRKWPMGKRQINDDVFTQRNEAATRAFDLGFENGETHVVTIADGQVVFRPGPSPEALMAAIGGEQEESKVGQSIITNTVRAIMNAVLGKGKEPEPEPEPVSKGLDVKFAKVDEEERLVFGFFSVSELNGELFVDSEGDTIAPDELEKAAYGHVLDARIASDSHIRMGVGKLVESVVFTPEKISAMVDALKAMEIEASLDIPAVAWWGGYYIEDDEVWKAIKDGTFVGFSIGGSASRETMNAE